MIRRTDPVILFNFLQVRGDGVSGAVGTGEVLLARSNSVVSNGLFAIICYE